MNANINQKGSRGRLDGRHVRDYNNALMGRAIRLFLAAVGTVIVVAGCQTTEPNFQVLDNAEFVRVTELGQVATSAATNATASGQLPSLRALNQPVASTTQSNIDLTTTNAPAATDSKARVITPGVVVNIVVEEDHALDRQYAVLNNGSIDFPPLGRFQVDGMTTDDLAKKIKQGLEKDFFQVATVYVTVDLAQTVQQAGVIYLLGNVGRPGPLLLPRDEKFTVMKAIIATGGCGQFANCKKVELIRYGPNGKKYKTLVNVERIMTGFFEEDIAVQNGDWLIVPEKLFSF